ncbi:MAG: hypothetical protein ACJ8AG_08880 [Ktedonobacteraceae bacterium]
MTLWEHVTTPDGEYGTRRLVQWERNAAVRTVFYTLMAPTRWISRRFSGQRR